MADSDDEDLKRAIALSLQDVSNQKEPVIIDLLSDDDDDDDDDDLDAPVFTKQILTSNPPNQKAIKKTEGTISNVPDSANEAPLSQQNILKHEPNSSQGATPSSLAAENTPQQAPPTAQLGLRGFDRKRMEEERLARVNQKRKREEESAAMANDSRKRVATRSLNEIEIKGEQPSLAELLKSQSFPAKKLDNLVSENTAGKDMKKPDVIPPTALKEKIPVREVKLDKGKSIETYPSTERANSVNSAPIMSYQSQQQIIDNSGIQYPNGVVKKTWVYGCPRQGDDIKIEEVFQKSTLEIAVLSAFQVDPAWVLSKLDPRTKVIWVVQAKDEAEEQEIRQGADKNSRFCFPSMKGQINCMHSKLQLLAHPTHMRIVVPSANLVAYDWGESGVIENICFLIDLPRLPDGEKTEIDDLPAFGKELFRFVAAMGLDQRMIESMRKFDYCRTSHLAFVHSIGGSHTGAQWKSTGYCGLSTSVRSLGLATGDALDIDFVTASIGALNTGFIQAMYLAAQGDDGMTEYGWRTNKTAKNKTVTERERKLSDALRHRWRIYFPTRDTVAASKGGIGSGGTICFQPRWYDQETFPRQLMRDCKSQRQGLLIHSKMWFVRPHGEGSRAWAYLGSANLSESAWGKLVKDRTTKEPKLTCRNWECGVIFPVPAGVATPDSTRSGDAKFSLEVFQGHVPVPMVVPGEEYGERRPWFYSEQ